METIMGHRKDGGVGVMDGKNVQVNAEEIKFLKHKSKGLDRIYDDMRKELGFSEFKPNMPSAKQLKALEKEVK